MLISVSSVKSRRRHDNLVRNVDNSAIHLRIVVDGPIFTVSCEKGLKLCLNYLVQQNGPEI